MTDAELIARLRDDSGDWLTDAAADRIEALIAERDYTEGTNNTLIALNQALEAKLAKAVEALENVHRFGVITHPAIATLAEIKGESHD